MAEYNWISSTLQWSDLFREEAVRIRAMRDPEISTEIRDICAGNAQRESDFLEAQVYTAVCGFIWCLMCPDGDSEVCSACGGARTLPLRIEPKDKSRPS